MKYIITIGLNNTSIVNQTFNAPYYHSNGKTDKFEFNGNSIIIEGERGKKMSGSDILFNVQNSFYNQLLKTLLFHYCINGNSAEINSISIKLIQNGKETELICQQFTRDKQPFGICSSPIPFDQSSLSLLFGEGDINYRLRIIVTHLLQAITESDVVKKLEGVWRAFERIAVYLLKQPLTKRPNISNALNKMLKEITTRCSRYSNTARLVHGMSVANLRQFRWHDMIENNYQPTASLDKYREYKQKLSDFFVDYRVAQINLDLLHYRATELRSFGLYDQIENDCNVNITNHITKDVDLIAFICCNYVYFLRNKLFHGETVVRRSIFDFSDSDDLRLNELIKMLTTLTVELINNFNNL